MEYKANIFVIKFHSKYQSTLVGGQLGGALAHRTKNVARTLAVETVSARADARHPLGVPVGETHRS